MSRQSEAAYQFIKSRILDGTYRPSQKLNESYLSEVIGVSRNTVKKALLMLERENLVEVENNKGATIKSFTLEEILNYMEIREVLEALVARKAVENITEEQLARMEQILQQMRDHFNNNELEAYSRCNRDFHGVIYEASTNQEAVQLITTIKTQLNRFQLRTILLPGRSEGSYREHENILNALKSRDPEAVEEALRTHISSVRNLIAQHYHLLN